MILSNAYDYINILDKAGDASFLRQTMITNNIANAYTPNYKRQDLEFEDVLKRELLRTEHKTLDQAVHDADPSRMNGVQYTDHPGFSYRYDKNNVDPDTEAVDLASEQIRYQTLMQSVTMDVARLKAVIK